MKIQNIGMLYLQTEGEYYFSEKSLSVQVIATLHAIYSLDFCRFSVKCI